MILFFILIALTGICQSLEPIEISQERGLSVLANLSDVPANQSGQIATVLNLSAQNPSNQSESQSDQTSSGLWSWGTIPVGYELNENGTLTRLTGEQWTPSI